MGRTSRKSSPEEVMVSSMAERSARVERRSVARRHAQKALIGESGRKSSPMPMEESATSRCARGGAALRLRERTLLGGVVM